MTPGSSWMALITSTSPMKAGMRLIWSICMVTEDICTSFTCCSAVVEPWTTASPMSMPPDSSFTSSLTDSCKSTCWLKVWKPM